MCSADTLMAPSTAMTQYAQGKQQERYYNYLAEQTKQQSIEVDNATVNELGQIGAQEVRETNQVKQDTNQTIASQKAAMAANGVYSDSGTFADIVGDSVDKLALDEAMIKYNADQSRWQSKRNAINQKMGLSAQATTYKIQASNAKTTGRINATSTLVGGAYSGGIGAAKLAAGMPA